MAVDPRNPQLDAIANTPTAYWMDNLSTPAVDAKYIAAAQAAGTMPVLALYGIPHRDCGSFAAGGFGSADAYRGWIDGVASAIGSWTGGDHPRTRRAGHGRLSVG